MANIFTVLKFFGRFLTHLVAFLAPINKEIACGMSSKMSSF